MDEEEGSTEGSPLVCARLLACGNILYDPYTERIVARE